MASIFMGSCRVLLFSAFFMSVFLYPTVTSFEFEVGDDEGWVVPPAKDQQFYNEWASRNRFQVNQTLRFKYKKDSVMEVSDEEYDNCKSSEPIFFSNNGDTEFKLERPGLFYFISGVAGHCERGLKMIVKVLEPENPPPPSPPSDDASASATMSSPTAVVAVFLVSFFQALLM
ncbi:mavicyanin-like [Diospyros lotus]|uniref:mavicyanin-like n=1 Tax=Diospyros lotus TaxID=55363 RepID=UPI0022588BF5|nr:mavicyanin-like [Diospyros lotus]